MAEVYETEDAELVVSAYGIAGRIAKGAVKMARQKGLRVGLIRPLCVWPFPVRPYQQALQTADQFLVVEMSYGQFIEDVKLAIECERTVAFLGKGGGWYPSQEEILAEIERLLECKSAYKALKE